MLTSRRFAPALVSAALVGVAMLSAGCSGSGSSGTDNAASRAGCDPAAQVTCAGAAAPVYSLADVQPKSARFGESYGLEAFRGQVLVVALLAGWCPFCQSQAERLEALRLELEGQGQKVAFVTLHAADAEPYQAFITERCSFPMLQDTTAASAWAAHGGEKDDMFVYDAEGKLRAYLSASALGSRIALTGDGAGLLKQAIADASKP